MRREVAVLECERLALAAGRLLPRLVRSVRAGDGGRIRSMRQDGLSGLRAADAAEVSTDKRDNLLVVEAVADPRPISTSAILN